MAIMNWAAATPSAGHSALFHAKMNPSEQDERVGRRHLRPCRGEDNNRRETEREREGREAGLAISSDSRMLVVVFDAVGVGRLVAAIAPKSKRSKECAIYQRQS